MTCRPVILGRYLRVPILSPVPFCASCICTWEECSCCYPVLHSIVSLLVDDAIRVAVKFRAHTCRIVIEFRREIGAWKMQLWASQSLMLFVKYQYGTRLWLSMKRSSICGPAWYLAKCLLGQRGGLISDTSGMLSSPWIESWRLQTASTMCIIGNMLSLKMSIQIRSRFCNVGTEELDRTIANLAQSLSRLPCRGWSVRSKCCRRSRSLSTHGQSRLLFWLRF